jgi:hypothetical protein
MSFVCVLAACGTHHEGGGPDGSPDTPPDTGPFMEAPHPSPPVVMNAGGTVLATPKVVPVFFANDTAAQTDIEAFLTALAPSSYWAAVSMEYGVGALTIAPTVIATETPPTTDTALQALITSHAGGTGGWPASDANTIYAVFLPDGVTLTMGGGTSCKDFGGYHDETSAHVVYALMPRCTSMTFPGLQDVTIATSHELLEASTDPHPQSAPAFVSIDDDDAIWSLTPGAELGDMCEFARAAYQPLVGTYMVQRMWSNASAAAGHDPCVPVMPTPYVNAATNLQDITITAAGQSLTTRGVTVPVGMSKTVEVDLYSDAEAADWTVTAVDVASQIRMRPAELQLSLDKTTGHNGDKLQLTITRLKAGSTFGLSELAITSKVNNVTVGLWWALVN